MARKRISFPISLIPLLFVLAVFFVALAFLLELSFYHQLMGFQIERVFTLENYAYMLHPVYIRAIITTFRIAFIATFVSLFFAYPIAFWLARTKAKRMKKIAYALIVVSFLMGFIVRIYSWFAVLGEYGIIMDILSFFGFPRFSMLYTESAVILGATQWLTIFGILSLVGPIRQVEVPLEEAARSLGASRLRTFISVTLPLSIPGLLGAFSLCLTLAVAAFVTPLLLGGGVVTVMSILVYERFSETFNFPQGAAMAGLILVIVLVIIYVVNTVLMSRVKFLSSGR
jgi:putative spermidine/putrescine transport system permease protein